MKQILSKTINQFKYSKINDSSITGEERRLHAKISSTRKRCSTGDGVKQHADPPGKESTNVDLIARGGTFESRRAIE